MDREKIMSALDCRANDTDIDCRKCDYYIREDKPEYCDFRGMLRDALALLKEQDEEHRRLLSWLGKFCRHIDNGDAWLTDEENIAFFKEKMKQQFGWDTD